jgi:hypothetical protein
VLTLHNGVSDYLVIGFNRHGAFLAAAAGRTLTPAAWCAPITFTTRRSRDGCTRGKIAELSLCPDPRASHTTGCSAAVRVRPARHSCGRLGWNVGRRGDSRLRHASLAVCGRAHPGRLNRWRCCPGAALIEHPGQCGEKVESSIKRLVVGWAWKNWRLGLLPPELLRRPA